MVLDLEQLFTFPTEHSSIAARTVSLILLFSLKIRHHRSEKKTHDYSVSMILSAHNLCIHHINFYYSAFFIYFIYTRYEYDYNILLARVWSIPLHSFASENENVSNVCRSVNANICKEKKNSCRHTSHSLTHSYIRTQNLQRSSQQQLFRFFVGSAEKILFSTRVPLTNGLKTNIPTGVLSTWAQKLIYRHLSNANTLG